MEWMFMPLKRYADFSGRSRRMEYWMWTLFQFVLGFVYVTLVFAFIGTGIMTGDLTAVVAAGGVVLLITLLYWLICLVFFIPSLAVAVRRLHDTNRSGWWILAPLVPYLLMVVFVIGAGASVGPKPDETALATIGIAIMLLGLIMVVTGLIVFVFMLLEGTRGPNKYGPDPKAPVPVGVFS